MKTSSRNLCTLSIRLFLLIVAFYGEVASGITKVSLVDRSDPNYTDRCLEVTGELCDYCCMDDFEWCSRDIYNCEPLSDRNLGSMIDCAVTLAIIIFGFPLLGCILYQCLLVRFCLSCYPDTAGISCFECMLRCFYFSACCGRRFTNIYQRVEDTEENSKEDSK